jgi:site-specific DNA recombinase
MCVFAELERETTLGRTQDGLNRVLREGTYCGAYAPLGYRKVGERSASRLEVDEEPIPGFDFAPAELVRRIFRWAATEELSARKIALRLTEEGVPTPAAINRKNWKEWKKSRKPLKGNWEPRTVSLILQNSDYQGVHRYGAQAPGSRKGQREVVEQEVPAIVPPELWERANATLEENAGRFPRAAKYDYLLRGLMKCAGCGSTYSPYMSGAKRDYLYYGCGRRVLRRGGFAGHCSNPHLRGEELEAAIWADCEEFIRNPAAVLEELAALQSGQGERLEAIHEDMAEHARTLEALARQRNNVVTLRARDLIDDAEMEAQRLRLLREEEDEQASMERLRERMRAAQADRVSLEAVETFLRELNRKNDEPWSFEEKRHIVTMLVKRIVVEQGEHGEPVVRVQYCFSPALRDVGTTPADCSPSTCVRRRGRCRRGHPGG